MKLYRISSLSIILILIIGMCVTSCMKESSSSVLQSDEEVPAKYVPAPIVIPSDNLEWDESYHPDVPLTRADNQSDQMAVTSNNIYVGAVYSAESVEDLTFDWISKPVDPITVSYTFPRYFFDEIERPSVSGMYRSLNKAIDSPQFTGKQSLAFEYDIRDFSYYRELKLAFGANVNIASIFKLDASVNDTKITSTSGLFARVVQKNFSLIMDYPYDGNVFLDNDDLNAVVSQTPVYVNSIIFGRMAIIAIESGELNLTAEQKKILQEATMRIFVSGGAGQDVAKIVEGYNEFANFIINGGEFSKEVPGVPIFFTANYAEDNSVFRTTFTTE